MAMDLKQRTIVFVPFPGQGHVIPMLRLARILVDRSDISATIVVPDFIHRRMVDQHSVPGVALVSIPSGVQDDSDQAPGPPSFLHALEHYMPAQLEAMLMAQHGRGADRVSCLVIDLLASWAIPVAARCSLPVVGFWPAMLASYRTVAAIPKLVDKGLITESGMPSVHTLWRWNSFLSLMFS
jgi:UDP:flavonoid glycosyltransferase YjiC (YdhE family)